MSSCSDNVLLMSQYVMWFFWQSTILMMSLPWVLTELTYWQRSQHRANITWRQWWCILCSKWKHTGDKNGKKLGHSQQDKSRNGHEVRITTSSCSGHQLVIGIGEMEKKRTWTNYAMALELDRKWEDVPGATQLTVIGEEARDVF